VATAVFAAKVTFVSVYPYVGFGDITAAAHAVADIAYLGDKLTPDKTPPGALVVSTSTTVDPSVCGGGVTDGDGVKEGVPDLDGEPDGVPDGDGVPDCVRDDDGVPDRVGVTVGD